MPWDGATWVAYETLRGNTTDIVSVFQYNDDITGGIFGVGILVMIFLIMLVGTSRTAGGSSLALSLFVTAILSYLLAAVDIVMDEIAMAMTIVLMVAVALMYKGGSRNV